MLEKFHLNYKINNFIFCFVLFCFECVFIFLNYAFLNIIFMFISTQSEFIFIWILELNVYFLKE